MCDCVGECESECVSAAACMNESVGERLGNTEKKMKISEVLE